MAGRQSGAGTDAADEAEEAASDSADLPTPGTARLGSAPIPEKQELLSLVMGTIAGMVVHRERQLLFANPAMAEILGYDTVPEVLAMGTIDAFVHPDERARVQGYGAQRMRGESAPEQYPCRLVNRNGEAFWVNTLNRVVDWQGAPAILTTMYDVSARVRTEEELRRSEAKFRRLIEHSNQGIVIHRERHILFANQAYADMFGYVDLDAVMADGTLDATIAPDELERLRSYNEARLRGETVPELYQSRGLRKDGREVWVNNLNHVIEWEGQPAVLTTLFDVTAHKQAADRLARNEQMFRNLVEGSIQGIVVSRDRRILFANEALARMYRYADAAELVGGSLDSLVAPRMQDQVRDYAARRMRGEPVPDAYEIEGVRKDGSHIWIASLNNVIEWEDGPAILGTSFDITERKAAERALRASETKFRNLIEGSIQGVVVHRNGCPVFANQAAAHIFGYDSPEELLALGSIDPTIAPEELDRLHAYARARREGHEAPSTYTFAGLRRDGRRIWIANLSHAIDWDGAPATLSTMYEITEQKEAEEALRRSERRYRELIEQANDGVHVIGPDGRILDTNTAGHAIFGYSREEFLGLTIYDITAPEDLAERPFTTYKLKPGETRLVDRLLVRKDGSRFPGEISSRRMDNGTVLSILRDVSERNALQAQLLQAQKMEAMGQLTGGIAHDFNNLLAIVLGNLELLSEELAGQPERLELLRRAREAVGRGAKLTERLLAFSRKQVLQPRPTAINDLVENVAQMLQRTLEAHIELKLTLAPRLWLAEVDAVQLETALLNLALNARDAMPQGGRLSLRTENAQVEGSGTIPDGRYVTLTIEDSGCGMPEDVRGRAFEPFFTTKEVGRGSGLGLSMVYGFVTQSGGSVTLDSAEGEGTRVCIMLPAAVNQGRIVPEPERIPEAEAPAAEGLDILVVEDDPGVRELAVRLLTGLGHRTVAAAQAREALALLDAHPEVNLLFTDVVLPGGLTGIDLARRVRERRPEMRVLFTSGYPKPVVEAYFEPHELTNLLPKPYTGTHLRHALRRAMAGTGHTT